MKKIILVLILIFSFFQVSHYAFADKKTGDASQKVESSTQRVNETRRALETAKAGWDSNAIKQAQESYNQARQELAEAQRAEYEENCAATGDCLEKPSWKLNVWSFTPGNTFTSQKSIENRADWFFWKLVKNLMIILWVLSVFIMTIGWWYMILHNWQDELLNKWKTIFMAWIYAMLIALSSYIIISIVTNLIY